MYYWISLTAISFLEIIESQFTDAHNAQMVHYGKNKQNLVDEWNLQAKGAYFYSLDHSVIRAVQRSLKYLSDNT